MAQSAGRARRPWPRRAGRTRPAARPGDGGGGRGEPASWLAARSVAVRSDPAAAAAVGIRGAGSRAGPARAPAGCGAGRSVRPAAPAGRWRWCLPALVYANPAFLRPCRHAAIEDRARSCRFYAADLVRAPDGTWNVLADRTGLADGLAHALQNRRRLGRVVPELFVSQLPCHIDPFVELCLDMLRRIAPTGSGGTADAGSRRPRLVRARAAGARTVLRAGRGRRPHGARRRPVPEDAAWPAADRRAAARYRRRPGRSAGARSGWRRRARTARRRARSRAHRQQPRQRSCRGAGVGSLPARDWRHGCSARRCPCPACRPSGWKIREARALVLRQPRGVVSPPGTRRRFTAGPVGGDGGAGAAGVARPDERRTLALRGEQRSSTPSVAPCLDDAGLEPRPVLVRMFLVRDREGWRAMPGGLGCVLPDGAQAWPSAGPVLAKDVWVLAENPASIEGSHHAQDAAAGDPPHRRRHAQPRGRQLLLARALPRAAGRRRAVAARDDRPPQPTGADAARDGRTGRADRVPRPGRAAQRRGDRRAWPRRPRPGTAARRRKLGLDPRPARPGLAGHWPVARPGDGRDARGHRPRPARGGGCARPHTRARRRPGAGCDIRGDVARPGVLRHPVRARRGEHGARRRPAVPGSRAPGGAGAGGGRPDRLRAGVPRRGAAAGARGARAAPGAGAVRFVDHLSQPVSGGAAAGTGARPAAGRRWQSARPGVPACRHACAAERDRRRHGCLARRRGGRIAGRAAGDGPRGGRGGRPVGGGACSCRRGCDRCAMRSPTCRTACRGAISRCCRRPARSASRRPHARCAGRRDLPRAARDAVRLPDAGRSRRASGASATAAAAVSEGAARRRACRTGGVMAARRQRPFRQRGDLAVPRCRARGVPGDRRRDRRCGFSRPTGCRGDAAVGNRRAGRRARPVPLPGRQPSSRSTVRVPRPMPVPGTMRRPASRRAARCWRHCST